MNKEDNVRKKTGYIVADQNEDFDALSELINCSKKCIPVILYGPPGTGKTRMVMDLKKYLETHGELGKFEVVQFHRKFSYEDFIEGYKPSGNGFIKKNGIFKDFCITGSEVGVDLFLIDEINRAELSTTFGEVLYALEDRDVRVIKTAHFSDTFYIPKNLMLIGTMNTADKNISNIDFAVRRRFRFIPVFPSVDNLRKWLLPLSVSPNQITLRDYCKFFSRTNNRIKANPQLGSHMQLGEALFVPSGIKGQIQDLDFLYNFRDVILPQVEAYLGFGSRGNLSSIFNTQVVDEFQEKRNIKLNSFIGLIKESANDRT